ncbi:MAG: hypothetical protein PWP72_2220 [Thermoanaerobacter sp.]|jgi:hypothetical protein|nr:hypothetical protein [Thermoanaerobacter sp.]
MKVASEGTLLQQAVHRARLLVPWSNIYIIGIRPTRPETGYGYIHVGPISRVEKGRAACPGYLLITVSWKRLIMFGPFPGILAGMTWVPGRPWSE